MDNEKLFQEMQNTVGMNVFMHTLMPDDESTWIRLVAGIEMLEKLAPLLCEDFWLILKEELITKLLDKGIPIIDDSEATTERELRESAVIYCLAMTKYNYVN